MEVIKNQDEMQGVIRNELNYSELVVESTEPYSEDYQVKMIRENSITGLLKMAVCNKDNCGQYIYDVSGMTTLQREVEKIPWDGTTIRAFLEQLLYMISRANNYMLDINCIVLNPQYIFCKEEQYYFCYYPVLKKSLAQSFHELTEFWVKSIDYSDYPTVVLACGLHKESMEEYYNLEELIETYTEQLVRQPELLRDASTWNVTEEREQLQSENTLWKTEEEYNSNVEKPGKVKDILRESPIGKYWEQKKKERWGEWDDLLTSEESSIIDRKNRMKL